MKRFALLLVLTMISSAPAAFAQNSGEFGIFAEYFRHDVTDTNHVGLGLRLGFNVSDNVAIEGEAAYDFRRTFRETFTGGPGGPITQDTNLRNIHVLVGPKFQTTGEVARAFAVLKAGFVNFGLSDEPVTGGTIISSFQNLREDDMNFSLFPGVGVELFLGPVGVRLDVGDQIYWSDGARHNLKITFGPHFQF